MTVSIWQPDPAGFLRGHRVRFAGGPVMTVMDYEKNGYEDGSSAITCGWWVAEELRVADFHPGVLIHAQIDTICSEPEDTSGEVVVYHEFYSEPDQLERP